jgi:AraC family transcriptional regulator of adaptative response/methylated-DNA-[protein]-cysteine methyltransferase
MPHSEGSIIRSAPGRTGEPPSQHERARHYASVERALQWLADNAHRQPPLDEAAKAAGMSPFHFQRVFSRWAGVSPKQFLQAMSLTRAKRCLSEGASVLDAAMHAGLSGPGRLHDAFVSVEAVTPGEFKRGLAGVVVDYGFHPSPFGECLLMSTPRGVCGLGFVSDGGRAAALADLSRRIPNATLRENATATAAVAAGVFAADPARADAPLRLLLCGTRFQLQVWRALLEIPPGGRASYGDLARHIGSPAAARAVGTAVGANPVSYLIPCHRVIRKTGALGGYHWGAGRKLAILGIEALGASGFS